MQENNIEKKEQVDKPKHQGKLQGLDHLSLGISVVVAIALGTGVGILLKNWTGESWTLFVGMFWGIAAAGLNLYRAYKRAQKEFEGMQDDPRYSYRAKHGDNSNDDD